MSYNIDDIKFVAQLSDEKWVMTMAFIVNLTVSRKELNMNEPSMEK
jgi:hypothetical protein